jgi:FkbM family methyltransferase
MKVGKVRQKVIAITRLLEKPRLIFLRNKKINLDTYESLDQPWIHDLKIETVLDIGANTGHFALAINDLFPAAKVYSFEPLPECFEELRIKVKHIPNIQVFNIALGNHSGSLEFRRNAHSVSSSFLEMTNIHKSAFPETSKSELTEVMIERLDDFVQELKITSSLLVKIDVQGFEDQVLTGGIQTICQAKLIIIETSFCTLYEKQPLFDDIYAILKSHNYLYAGALESLHDPKSGRVLQEDSIFIKSNKSM